MRRSFFLRLGFLASIIMISMILSGSKAPGNPKATARGGAARPLPPPGSKGAGAFLALEGPGCARLPLGNQVRILPEVRQLVASPIPGIWVWPLAR